MNVLWQQADQGTQVGADLITLSPLEIVQYQNDVAGGLHEAIHDRRRRRTERRILSGSPADDSDHQRVGKTNGVRLLLLQGQPQGLEAAVFEGTVPLREQAGLAVACRRVDEREPG